MNVTFDGTLLGNGKTITVTGNCAAIGKIGEHGVVSNVIVAGNVSTGSFAYIGALANTNNGKVENVLSTALVTSTAGLVADLSTEELGGAGGIVGLNDVKGTIITLHTKEIQAIVLLVLLKQTLVVVVLSVPTKVSLQMLPTKVA